MSTNDMLQEFNEEKHALDVKAEFDPLMACDPFEAKEECDPFEVKEECDPFEVKEECDPFEVKNECDNREGKEEFYISVAKLECDYTEVNDDHHYLEGRLVVSFQAATHIIDMKRIRQTAVTCTGSCISHLCMYRWPDVSNCRSLIGASWPRI